jgi:hypothetical protein
VRGEKEERGKSSLCLFKRPGIVSMVCFCLLRMVLNRIKLDLDVDND